MKLKLVHLCNYSNYNNLMEKSASIAKRYRELLRNKSDLTIIRPQNNIKVSDDCEIVIDSLDHDIFSKPEFYVKLTLIHGNKKGLYFMTVKDFSNMEILSLLNKLKNNNPKKRPAEDDINKIFKRMKLDDDSTNKEYVVREIKKTLKRFREDDSLDEYDNLYRESKKQKV